MPPNPQFEKAQARAESLVGQAQLNEAMRVIELLEAEITEMEIDQRFSRERKAGADPSMAAGAGHLLQQGLSEEAYKRQQLLMAARRIKDNLTSTITGIRDLVLDVEGAKAEGEEKEAGNAE